MSKLADVFLVPKTTQCPAAQAAGRFACHEHVAVHRLAILIWSGMSTLVGFLVGIVLSWIRDTEYTELFSSETLHALGELQSIPWFVWVVCVLVWGLSTLLVCARKFTTIQEYVIVGLVTPCFVVSLVSPLAYS